MTSVGVAMWVSSCALDGGAALSAGGAALSAGGAALSARGAAPRGGGSCGGLRNRLRRCFGSGPRSGFGGGLGGRSRSADRRGGGRVRLGLDVDGVRRAGRSARGG